MMVGTPTTLRATLAPVRGLRLPKYWAPITTAAVCLLRFALPGGSIRIDHEVDVETVRLMKHGANFWDAMDRALRHVYGPASTIRAFRMPTIFLVWRVLPDWAWWPLFIVMAGGCGWLASRLSGRAWTMPAVAALMAAYGKGPSYTQFLLVEPWAVPAILGCLVAYRRRKWALAAALALVAGLIREQAAVLLLLGLAVAVIRHQPWRAWAVGAVAWTVVFGIHVAELSPHLVKHGRDTHLIGSSRGLISVLHMAGFGLPLFLVTAPIGYILAAKAIRHVTMAPILAGFLAMPLIGFVVDRPYWGVLTVPVLLSSVALSPDTDSQMPATTHPDAGRSP
jgi:hypothetical protein